MFSANNQLLLKNNKNKKVEIKKKERDGLGEHGSSTLDICRRVPEAPRTLILML